MIESANVSGGIRRWGGLGNFIDGDCTVAAYYHIVMAKNVVRANPLAKLAYRIGFKIPGTKFAIARYSQYLATLNEKPSPGQGVAADGWLNWQQAQGEVTEWAILNSSTPDYEGRLRQAMVDFGGVILIGMISQESYNDWGRGNIWKYNPSVVLEQPDPNLGHAIAMLACHPTMDYAVTWGTWQAMTVEFRQACMKGALVFLHKDDEKLPDYAQRLAALQLIKAGQ